MVVTSVAELASQHKGTGIPSLLRSWWIKKGWGTVGVLAHYSEG